MIDELQFAVGKYEVLFYIVNGSCYSFQLAELKEYKPARKCKVAAILPATGNVQKVFKSKVKSVIVSNTSDW